MVFHAKVMGQRQTLNAYAEDVTKKNEQHSVPRFMHYNNFNVAMVFKFHAGDLEWKTTCSKTWKGKPQGNTKPRKKSKHRIPPKESLPKEI
jgi:hypothetical protein